MSLRFEGFAVDKGDHETAPGVSHDSAVYTVLVEPDTPIHVVCRTLTRKLPGYGEEAFNLLASPPHQGAMNRIRWANWGPQKRASATFAWWAGTQLHDTALAVFTLED